MTNISTRFFLFKGFIDFYREAHTANNIHSPFVYELANAVLEDDRTFYAFPIIEQLREKLLADNVLLPIEDLGAGSKADPKMLRSVSSVARHSAVEARVGRMLFRLVNWRKPRHILELGTSLGISTLYQATGALSAPVTTVEGCTSIAQVAEQNFHRTGFSKIRLINDSFDRALDILLRESTAGFDYVFLDGDHRSGSSIRYFERILPSLHQDSLFLLADIYWSQEMKTAWQELCRHPAVSLSIDLFHFGILFFRKEQRTQQHFRIVPRIWKPWVFTI